jgi:hypothetical protein
MIVPKNKQGRKIKKKKTKQREGKNERCRMNERDGIEE